MEPGSLWRKVNLGQDRLFQAILQRFTLSLSLSLSLSATAVSAVQFFVDPYRL